MTDTLLLALVIAAAPLPFDLFTCVCWIRKLRNGRGSSGCTPLPAILMFVALPWVFARAWLLEDKSTLAHLCSKLPSIVLGSVLMVTFHVLLCYYIPVWVHRRWLRANPGLETPP